MAMRANSMGRLMVCSAAGILLMSACTRPTGETKPTPPVRATFEVSPCPRDVTRRIENEVSCGYLTVLENRGDPGGRSVRVFVTRIQPPDGEPSPDPMFLPGTNLGLPPYYEGIAPMAERTHREVIIMDQRGLGHSEPILACPEVRPVAGVTIGTALMKALFLDAMQACHDRLTAQGIDVGSYNLAEIAADAEDLRMALGVDQWNLITLGTASSISFEIMRRYPEHVRAVVFDSPDAPQVDLLTEAVASTKYAVREVADACAADPRCDRTFPDLLGAWNQALRRLHAHPSRLTDEGNSLSMEPGVRVVIDAATAVRGMRNAFIWNAATFPRDVYSIQDYGYVINREPGRELDASWDPPFYQGYTPYYDSPAAGHFYSVGAIGTFYSVLCHDEVPFVDRAALAQAAKGEPWYIEAYGESPYFQGCTRWDTGTADADPHAPVVSDIPTLILHGRFDPYSALPLIKEAAKSLPRSWVVEFPDWSHNVLGSDCGPEVRNGWIDDPTSPPDTSCVADMDPVRFEEPVRLVGS